MTPATMDELVPSSHQPKAPEGMLPDTNFAEAFGLMVIVVRPATLLINCPAPVVKSCAAAVKLVSVTQMPTFTAVIVGSVGLVPETLFEYTFCNWLSPNAWLEVPERTAF